MLDVHLGVVLPEPRGQLRTTDYLAGTLEQGGQDLWFVNRADGTILGSYGSMGENGGQFFGLELAATDSRNNIYTGEVFSGERVQRLVPADSARGKLLGQLSRLP